MEPLNFSHHYTVSLVQWVNCLLSTWGRAAVRTLGVPHTYGLGFPVNNVSLYHNLTYVVLCPKFQKNGTVQFVNHL